MPAVAPPHERTPDVHVHPPTVFVPIKWEYHHMGRPLADGPPSDEELSALGLAGWELTGTYSDGTTAHFYFKRQAP